MYMLEDCLKEDVGAYCGNRGRMLGRILYSLLTLINGGGSFNLCSNSKYFRV